MSTLRTAGRALPWPCYALLLATSVVATSIAAVTLRLWPQPWDGDPLLWGELVVLAVIANNFPLEMGAKVKLTVSMAVYFAMLLLFPGPMTITGVATAQMLSGAVVSTRQRLAGRHVKSVHAIWFNTSQLVLVFGLGGLVYHAFLPRLAPAPIDRIENLWAVPVTIVVLYLGNSLLVAYMASLQMGRGLNEVWKLEDWLDKVQYAALFLVGLVAALVAPRSLAAPLVMAMPAVLIYLSLRRTRQLVVQAITSVEAIAAMVDARHPETFQHSERVAETAASVARRMGLRAEEIETIHLAARVHDLGKVGVPDRVLLKAGPLDPDERRLMERHPEIGYELLAPFPEYQKVRELVRDHHERFDGKGYPRGLCAGELPLGAQIIAVADALDAMTSDRPYRRAVSVEEAFDQLALGSGAQWHPRVVDALESVLALDERRVRRLRVVAT